MPFCPACRSEFRDGFVRCEECDQELVAEFPREPVPPPATLVCVYQSNDPQDALLVRSVLDGHGIEARAENEYASAWAIGMPIGAIPLRLSVRNDDAGDAAEILRSLPKPGPPTVDWPQIRAGWWLLGVALLVPSLTDTYFIGGRLFYAAPYVLGVLGLGLLLKVRDRAKVTEFTPPRMALFILLGAVVSIGLVMLADGFAPPSSREVAARQFLWVGPVEEAAKFLPVLVVLGLRRDWARNKFTWVLAGMASGIGFALTENLFRHQRPPLTNPFDVVTGLLHPMWTGLVGYTASMTAGVPGAFVGALLGWMAASLLHGAWNTLIFEDLGWISLMLFPLGAWGYWAGLRNWVAESREAPA